MAEYPTELEITPLTRPLDVVVRPPGSKSITNRALLVAALADGDSRLVGALQSDDTEAMRDCLAALGVAVGDEDGQVSVSGSGGRLAAPDRRLDARASGTTARFITAAAALAVGEVVVDGSARMRQRPIAELTDALIAMGAEVEVLGVAGCPPVRVVGGAPMKGGEVTIDATRSSQFASAVLMIGPFAKEGLHLRFRDGVLVSRPYVGTTLEIMRAFGADAAWADDGSVVVDPGRYGGRRFEVEADASAAAYPFAAAAVTGGRVTVEGLARGSTQADLGLLGVLERMGCRVKRTARAVEVEGPTPGGLLGVEVDMSEMPDAVLALAVVAAFADRASVITGAGTLRLKETDRLAALEAELRHIGAGAEAGADWLRVEPAPLHGGSIVTYDDHRMAMSFAIAGLAVPGVVIEDPGCVAKTWPAFFEELDRWRG